MTTDILSNFDSYVKAKGVNWSLLKHFFKSPAHVKEAMDAEEVESDAMQLGKLQHMALLEPERLMDECIAAPDFGYLMKHDASGTTTEQGRENKKRKAEFEAEHADKTIIAAKDYAALVGMSKSAYAHPEAKELLKSIAQTEQAIFWQDKETGVDCKGLLDLVSDRGCLVDLKTTEDCRYSFFQRKAAQLHYFGQMAYYLRGALELNMGLEKAVWIVIENKAPYAVRCYYLGDLEKEKCNETINIFLRRYKVCTEQDFWPQYQDELQELSAPDWYLSQLAAVL